MPASPDRALLVRTADRLRAGLARDEISGLPSVGALSDDNQRELCTVGGGRLAAVLIHVEWTTDAVAYPRPLHHVRTLVMREVARIVDEHVRHTDLLGSLSADALLILGPGLDPMSGQSLAKRVRTLFADRQLAVGDVLVRLHVTIGCASRSAASPAGWTIQTLVDEAERNASDPPPIAIVA